MVNELEKVLSKLGVTAKIREVPGIPAKGAPIEARCWRVTLARPVKGEEKPLQLSFVFFSPNESGEPSLPSVVESLASDVAAGEMTLWDFATANRMSLADNSGDVERIHKACKRIGPRVKKFFGDSWKDMATAKPSVAA